jgi:hypothetical protein
MGPTGGSAPGGGMSERGGQSGGQAQRESSPSDRRSGQREQRGQREQGQREQRGQRNGQRDSNTGQNMDRDRDRGQTQRGQRGDREQGQRGDRQMQGGRDADPNRAQSGRNGQRGDRGENTGATQSNVQVTTEQRTRIRERSSTLRAGRVDNVNFSISVGTVVPRSVRVHVLPREVVEIVPAYRGYKYILVGDEIIIVHPRTLRIVAVIEA